MKVSVEKSKFFKTEVDYLGFVVSRGGVKTNPNKVHSIKCYEQPTTLRGLRSFLGLASYYRCFIKDFASIAKPLTDMLKGENGKVSATQSKKIKIQLTSEGVEAFNKLREILASEDVTLTYPDFTKPFDLTTDASSRGLGAVLSQERKPITMISRTLRDREEHLATNERELLAIVWALNTLRNYLYGVNQLNIFTDHQPLTFAVSDKNPNAKIKRWKSLVESFNAKIFYKPGKENHVADALSRQHMNMVEVGMEPSSDCATIHSEESLTYTIETVDKPVNCFRNQIVLQECESPSKQTFILFGSKTRHIVSFRDTDSLIDTLQEVINDGVVNAIHCSLPVLAKIQHRLVELHPNVKFRHTEKMVTDIFSEGDQHEIVVAEHNRAHRAAQENVKQILADYFFPKMDKKAREVVANCRICSKSKYDRHPKKHVIAATPIPSHIGQILHIDIFSTDQKYFLTCIDKLSKFAIVQKISSRTIIDIKPPILQLINIFPNVKTIYCDNEKSLNSHTIKSILLDYNNVTIANAPPLHSTSNGQVERFHSTLTEIARCLKLERNLSDTVDLILLATIEYNKSIHSVINRKPIDVLYSSSTNTVESIRDRIEKTQAADRDYHNRNRQDMSYNAGDRVLVKVNRRLGNKLSALYVEEVVEQDLGTTVLIKGRRVHKDNIRPP